MISTIAVGPGEGLLSATQLVYVEMLAVDSTCPPG